MTFDHRSQRCALILACLLLLGSACTPSPTPTPASPTVSDTPTPSQTASEAATQTPWIITVLPQATQDLPGEAQGTFILSLPDGGYDHLFAYNPASLPLTRLTASPWDDISPALSPDGNWVLFASRQNGYWDLYMLNLQSGGILRLTDSPEYDGAPAWSPDGSWLVHETYTDQGMEIIIRSAIDPSVLPIQITNDTFLDSSPTWSPLGRQIAFVSNRSGEPEIWIVDLDRASSDQFINVSNSTGTLESHPAWSPDGTRLAWASADPVTGLTSLWVWNILSPDAPAVRIGAGDLPVWQDQEILATRLSAPTQVHLTAYHLPSSLLTLPPVLLPGDPQGMDFGVTSVSLPGIFAASASLTPALLYLPAEDGGSDTLPGRTALVDLSDVVASYPQLSDAVDEAFQALRARVALECGWDVLANLENAFVPLSVPLDPGLEQDWLYSGRAFTLNTALIQAGWMVVVRQDFGQQTWWRIYLYTTAQDGSMGRPLAEQPWDFSTRSGSSQAYEQGGTLMDSIPGGYWLDLTALAAEFGWERLPALTTWRTYYSGAHFNELAFTAGLDWYTAMLELYPPEALTTPTIVIPPTRTVTRTPLYYRSPTPTRTSTPRPTNTP